MTSSGKDKRIKSIMMLLDPQKVKTSVVMMLIIIIVSGLVLLSAYLQARNQMEETSMDLVVKRAAENVSLLDRNLTSFQKTLYSLAVDNDIFWLKNWNEYSDTERLDLYYSASTRIRSIEVPDADILDLYACFPSQGLVLADGVYRMDDYGVLSAEQWENLKTNDLNLFISSGESSGGGAEIRQAYLAHKVGYNVKETGFVVMKIRPEAITGILGSSNRLEAEAVYVTDAGGNVIYMSGALSLDDWQSLNAQLDGDGSGMIRHGSDSYFVVGDTVAITGWRYRMAIPRDKLISGQRFNTSMMFLVAVLLVMALAFGMLGAQFAFRPLERLYSSVSRRWSRSEQPDRSVYLTRVFDRVFSENDDLRTMARRNLPLLQEKMLMQMVMQPDKDSGGGAMLENLGFSFGEPYFRVAVICYHLDALGVSPVEMLKVEMFNEFWNERLSTQGTCRMVLFEPQRFFIVINYADAQKDGIYWRNWFNDRVREFNDEFHCEMTGAISLMKTSVSELNAAFLEALRTFERQLIVGPGFVEVYEKQIRFGELKLVYPFEMLQKLVNVLRTTDSAAAHRFLNEIGAFIKANPPRSEFALRQIFLYMSGTLRQLLLEIDEEFHGDNQSDEDMTDLMAARGIDSHMASFTALADHIQTAYGKYYSGRRQSLHDQIMDYIRENHTQILSPEDIAAHFYISTTYLYRLMKSEGGTSPAHFLTTVRIEEAADLLLNSDMPVGDISGKCGFESEQSFYRNFKRIYGCTPSQYRATNQNRQDGRSGG